MKKSLLFLVFIISILGISVNVNAAGEMLGSRNVQYPDSSKFFDVGQVVELIVDIPRVSFCHNGNLNLEPSQIQVTDSNPSDLNVIQWSSPVFNRVLNVAIIKGTVKSIDGRSPYYIPNINYLFQGVEIIHQPLPGYSYAGTGDWGMYREFNYGPSNPGGKINLQSYISLPQEIVIFKGSNLSVEAKKKTDLDIYVEWNLKENVSLESDISLTPDPSNTFKLDIAAKKIGEYTLVGTIKSIDDVELLKSEYKVKVIDVNMPNSIIIPTSKGNSFENDYIISSSSGVALNNLSIESFTLDSNSSSLITSFDIIRKNVNTITVRATLANNIDNESQTMVNLALKYKNLDHINATQTTKNIPILILKETSIF